MYIALSLPFEKGALNYYGRKNNRSDDLLLFRVLKKVMVFLSSD